MEEISIDKAVTPKLQVKIKAMAFVRANQARTWGMNAVRARQNGDKPPRVTKPITKPELFETIVEIPDLYVQTYKVSHHDPEARRFDESMKQRITSQVHLSAHYAWVAKMQERMKADPAFAKHVKKTNAVGEFHELTYEILPLEQ